tara:strand:- start:4073 stop:5212 length:1140 start_codon:yes stop_codon:yes gene_type:complete
MKKFKVSFIGFIDYANCMTEYSKGINRYSENYESKIICHHPHSFNYETPHDYDLYKIAPSGNGWVRKENTIKEAINWVKESSHIIIAEERKPNRLPLTLPIKDATTLSLQTIVEIFSNTLKIDIVRDTQAGQNNNLHLFHPGSIYRNQPQLFNQIGDKCFNKIIYGLDLFRFSPKDNRVNNKHLVFYPISDKNFDKKEILTSIDEKFDTEEMTILHIPSSKHLKGTTPIINNVNKVINQLNKKGPIHYKLVVPPKLIPFSEVIELKKKSHIYIDQFNQWGGIGVSAIESLMLGNLTFSTTQFDTIESIRAANKNLNCGDDFYFIHLGVTHEEFINTLDFYLRKPITEIKEITKKGVEWYYKVLTHQAISHKFEKEIFDS